MANEDLLEEARASLTRMRQFDVSTLARTDLGEAVDFEPVQAPAKRLLELYNRLPVEILDDLPEPQLTAVKNLADANFNILNDIVNFDINAGGQPLNERATAFIEKVSQTYAGTFNSLHPWISYSAQRLTDFRALENRARATEQAITDRSKKLMKELKATKESADTVLSQVRQVAAETGVSQQAAYFHAEAKHHATEADTARGTMVNWAWGIGAYLVLTLFVHEIPGLKPDDAYESFQLAASKVLGFTVLSFLLGIATRNYLSHRHNAVVNKHRQNALLTYRALVEAADAPANQDVILAQAAHCIFGAQGTGYVRAAGPEAPSMKSVVEMVSKIPKVTS